MPSQHRAHLWRANATDRWNLLHVTVTAVAARGFSKRSLLSVAWLKLSVTHGSLWISFKQLIKQLIKQLK